MRQRLPVFVAALWWGSLTALGFMVVPLLFARLETPAIAGRMAAQLFTAQTWLSMGCGLLLLMVLQRRSRSDFEQKQAVAPVDKAQSALLFIVFGMLLALLVEFAVAPRILAREQLRLWHGIGTAMYVLQWLASAIVLWKVADRIEASTPEHGPS